jgi:hypothetical protein
MFGSGKPRGVGISGKRPHGLGEGNGESVYEEPGNEVDGSCHSKEGSKLVEKGRTRGARGARGIIVYIQSISSRVYNRMLVVIE